MSLHKEIAFESEICAHLASAGWLHDEGDSPKYDRARAMFPEDVLAWVQETQPAAWKTLQKNHGAAAGETLLNRLRESLDKTGTLDVLRHGIDVLGLRGKVTLAQFKPAMSINPDILSRYAANRLRVIRQVRYSLHNEKNIDLVLFLNGLPVATVELKTDFTQNISDAVSQYKRDRLPRSKGKAAEPLLSFPSGALVHFAVSNSEVEMTTKLAGPATRFLPFNQGDGGAKGNPGNPDGHRTAYLWESVWQRDSWLEILGRYMVAEKDKKGQITKVIFPRYHQLDATRKLQEAIQADGPGGRYLVQHSAGSGKTNSIAWSAHFLADLHDADHKKLFDTVLVVSDRNVIDTQLQEAIYGFERTTGVVASIKGESSSKSGELAEALSGDKKIVVCTIQTFPFALERVRELTATENKRFAVIADEAHSSQSGEAASKLKQVLSQEEMDDLADGGEVTMDDVLAAQMAGRAQDAGITFVAFTATPKSKTMELFGTRPDPARKPASDNIPEPFHVYSMRQAIEEGFILDVLQNYTTYSLAFKLAHDGKEIDEKEVEKSAALKRIMGWVKLHPYNISQKVEVVVEHFQTHVAPLLEGRAKAMIVVSSRQEAVRWKLAIDKYITDRGYGIGTMVAFSGEVKDKESGPEPFTEAGKAMNPTLGGKKIRDAFDTDEYQILLVANKFQTGFDQPLLCGMYVDKRLAGIQAVQTLSRLNRAHPNKDTTYVLDFVNSTEEVLAAFKTYFETAELADTTDPNLVLDLRSKLDVAGHYDDFEVDRVVAVELRPDAKQAELVSALEPVVDRLMKKFRAAQEALQQAKNREDEKAKEEATSEIDAIILFKRNLGAFLRLYTFLSQIFDYGNTDIEKRAIFYRRLLPLLDFGRERAGIDLSKLMMTHHKLKNHGERAVSLNQGDSPQLDPLTGVGSGEVQEKQTAYLAELLEKVNELFDGDLTDQDKLVYVNRVIKGKMMESEVLRKQAASNTKQQFANSPDLMRELTSALMGALEAHTLMSTQALGSKLMQEKLRDVLLGPARLYEDLKEQVG
jgi:type I restriction enzyme R subunit